MATDDETEELAGWLDDESPEIIPYIPDADTTCTICNAEFLDPDDLKIHLTQVHRIASSVLRNCHFCSEEYTDMMNYAEHIRDFHIKTLKICSKCWRIFNDFDEHRKHCKKHIISTDLNYSCSQCKQRFGDLFLLKQHEFEHQDDSDGVMLYELLPYLSAALKVKSITFLESMDTDVVYICVGCDFSSVDISMFLRHAKSNKCKVFVCETCGNVYPKKRNIARHAGTRCNMFGFKERKMRKCIDCNTYINAHQYARHKLHCRPIKCYTCDITFASMNDWTDHQTREHPGISVEVETCKFCWKRCVGSVAMQKHIDKTHKPELHLYKYLCIYCKSVFKHPQKLFGHFFTKHKDIFPYTCKICDKTFRFRKRLTIHIKLEHNSVGFVEFDENYHVFFTDKKSEHPFVPKSIYVNETKDQEKEEDDDKTDCETEPEDSVNIELNSEFMNVTGTEDIQTEAEIDIKKKENPKLKRKRTSKGKKGEDSTSIAVASSDDEPLLAVRKRVRLQKTKSMTAKQKRLNQSRTVLTCNICNKYCYTFQNYNHHISLHSKHDIKKCIKCSKIFKSKAKLKAHVASAHSSSKLTETLKTLLEKRKTGKSLSEDLPSSIKFRRTIKKATTEASTTSAKITEVDHKLSVQKFFENFVPEENKDFTIDTTASIKLVTGFIKEPSIKMIKFKPNPIKTTLKLSMPVKFVDNHHDKTKVTIKLVDKPPVTSIVEDRTDYYKMDDYSDQYDEPDMDRHEPIPEVAEEILLEGTEELPKSNKIEVSHKIIIPKLPTEITDIRIAHLLPQAPFYKIVKVKDVLVQNEPEKNDPVNSIELADGTKLVTTNPLAHLLGEEHKKVLNAMKNKYYKSRNQNLPVMLAKALTMLEKPTPSKKERKKIKAEIKTEEDS